MLGDEGRGMRASCTCVCCVSSECRAPRRQVPMAEEALEGSAPETAGPLRALGEGDRDIMERATRAFVSYVRGYKEHQARALLLLLRSSVTCGSRVRMRAMIGLAVILT